MPATSINLAWFLANLLSSAVVSGIVAALFRQREIRQIHVQAKEIDDIRHAQRRNENRDKTQFDWLHQKRAEAICEIYSLVIDVDSSLVHLIGMLTHGIPGHEEKLRISNEAEKLSAALRNRCSQVALLLPESIVGSLDEIDGLLWTQLGLATVYSNQTADDRSFLAKQNELPKVRASIKVLRGELRRALGDVADEARK